MKNISRIMIGVAVFAAMAAAADMLTGKNGMTLYTFDQDSGGKSACTAQCAAMWPPAAASDASGTDFGAITRDDGSKQLTYQGKPLYYHAGDKKAGDAKGDNMGNVWHVAKPGAVAKGTDSGKPGGMSY